MHIKKLEISGFKSFVDRTVVHFDHDIIGIVGPNGCGKSNIVDAIRWSMGEQSAKHLRGRAMTDVIFAGSGSRGPHGMAEVTLTFDNTDKEAAQALPLEYRDWADIAITRRLYRDGTSEYLINKTQVRLKDVTDLFLGTGVGTKAYSIIEQGKVGLIVSARAEDRRLIIEEAAGITKYKARRKQAEAKMEATRQNLLRVGDIVSEIERNLASLKRQAAKAERYIAYKGELEDLVLCEASHKLLEFIVCAQVEEAGRAISSEACDVFQTEVATREAELEVDRQRGLSAEDLAEAAQTDAYRKGNQVRTHEAEIGRAAERYRDLEQRSAVAKTELADLQVRLAELAEEREALADVLASAEEDEARGQAITQAEMETLEELRQNAQEADERLTEARALASELSSRVAAAEATLRGYEERRGDWMRRSENLEDEDGRLSGEHEDIAARHEGLVEHIIGLTEARAAALTSREERTAELKTLREQAVELDREVESEKSELGQRRSRLRALEELHARHEGVGQGPRALMSTNDPTIVGLVADRLEAPAELTHALAAALGDKIEFVVVDDLQRGKALLRELGLAGKGRAGIVPRFPRHVAGSHPVAPRGEGVSGLLVDAILFAPEDEVLARSLIGDVALVDSDETAEAVLSAGHLGRVVTLAGTLHSSDGSVIGGAGNRVAEGLVEHKREMRELHEACSTRGDRVTELLAKQAESRAQMTEIGGLLDQARSEAHASEIAFMAAEKDQKRGDEQLAQLSKRLLTVRTERAEIAERIATATVAHDEASRGLDSSRLQKGEAIAEVETTQAHSESWRAKVTVQQAVVTERKVLLAQIKERTSGVRHTVERLSKSCEEMSQRIERLDRERFECATGAGTSAARIMIERELLVVALEEARAAEELLSTAKTAVDEIRHLLSFAEVDLKKARQAASEATEELRTRETNLAKLLIERRHLTDGVRDRFRGLELHTVIGDYHKRAPLQAQQRSRITELGELLDRMGPVNVDAVREHAEAEERFTYYTTQKADLDKAIADLEEAILQMNRESKRLFREAFEGINAKFKVLFPRMFRGGQGELRLTNPDDLLETGIEILAQPPGKKLSSIDLMSGGEKALTAVSLIFAIFQFKPSPFCVLDEVDAPLDEANVTRYNEAIRTMTGRSQFILITHIKRTMQSVDVLYGVTMQEPGVSKLVGVKVNETAAPRSLSAPPEAAAAAVA